MAANPANPASAPVATDFSAYAPLKAQAREHDPAALRAVAQQFEALFTQMMLKSMRDASLAETNLMDGEQSGLYRDLFDQQIALSMSSGKGRGLGIADMMIRQLQARLGSAPAAAAESGAPVPIALTAASRAAEHVALTSAPNAPDEFIGKVLPHAEKAGKALGVSPHLLIAQSALETGWGRAVPATADGGSSHNLFGIKAGARWSGARTTIATQEYAGARPHTEQAAFRAYASVAESFDDYARVVGGQARYAQARGAGADSTRFAAGLQQAGYATDPAYAEKIRAIADDPGFQARVARAQGLA